MSAARPGDTDDPEHGRDLRAFREHARAFLAAEASRLAWDRPPPTDEDDATRAARAVDCQRRLLAAGLAGITWPVDVGGQGLGGGRPVGPEGSLLKLAGTRRSQRSAELGASIAGPHAQAWSRATSNRWSDVLLASPGLSIAGGTTEVQRNIIGERVLGLPREPATGREPDQATGAP